MFLEEQHRICFPSHLSRQDGIHGLWLRTSVYGGGGSSPAANRVLLGVYEDTRPWDLRSTFTSAVSRWRYFHEASLLPVGDHCSF